MYIVKTYILVEQDTPEVYETKDEADAVAQHIMFMQPEDVIAVVEEKE